MGLKTYYGRVARSAPSVARSTALLGVLARSHRPALRHVRNLSAVYDAEDPARLDLPWWSYGIIARVEEFLAERPQARVFEFGSGASTPWLAKRAASVHSVEHDLDFVKVVRGLLEGFENVAIHTVAVPVAPDGNPAVGSDRDGHEGLDFLEYVRVIDEVGGPFDVIVVDGRLRVASLRRAIPHVAPDGVIPFDDGERHRCAAALEMPGLSVEVLHTAPHCLPCRTSTALSQRSGDPL